MFFLQKAIVNGQLVPFPIIYYYFVIMGSKVRSVATGKREVDYQGYYYAGFGQLGL